MFKTILFPIDRSRESSQAVDTVINVVQKYNSRLVLLTVVETHLPNSEEELPAEDVLNLTEALAQLLSKAQELFAQKGIQAEVIEREGIPSFTICDVADEIEANLIIMGCRGTGLTNEGAAESVTNRVINLSPCPVLIVP